MPKTTKKKEPQVLYFRRFNWRIASGEHCHILEPDGEFVDMNLSPIELIAPPLDIIIEKSATLTFTLDYPLSKPFEFSETHADGTGWTEKQFCEVIRESYLQIYDEEENSQKELIPSIEERIKRGGLINRPQSDGKWGIWGHDISDLFIECLSKKEDGSWEIDIGS